jgi:hypothetical protein
VDTLPLEALAAQFSACTLPREQWTHAAHLRVGAWHVDRYGADEALRRLRSGIRALNESHGNLNSDSAGYHETITVAYVRLIAMFLAGFDAGVALEDKVSRLLASPLSTKDVLRTFWSRAALMSPVARARWVDPDLAPLALPWA